MNKFLEDQYYVNYMHAFRAYWAIAVNRRTMINEFRYIIGEKICRGETFVSLPVTVANTCINVFHRFGIKLGFGEL